MTVWERAREYARARQLLEGLLGEGQASRIFRHLEPVARGAAGRSLTPWELVEGCMRREGIADPVIRACRIVYGLETGRLNALQALDLHRGPGDPVFEQLRAWGILDTSSEPGGRLRPGARDRAEDRAKE